MALHSPFMNDDSRARDQRRRHAAMAAGAPVAGAFEAVHTLPDDSRARDRRRRRAAMAAGALVAGAFEAAHTLAWSGRVDGRSVAFMALAVWLELEVLTALFDRMSRPKGPS